MKFAYAEFNHTVQMNPKWSTLICFSETIKNKKLPETIVTKVFNKVVDKEDYRRKDKKSIISHLCSL